MKNNSHIVSDFESPDSATDVYSIKRFNQMDRALVEVSKRLKYLEDGGRLVERSGEIKEEYSNYGVLKSLITASLAASEAANVITHRKQINYVSVYTVEKCIAIAIALVCSTSLLAWVVTEVPIINPFAALLGLTSSPFFYWMAKVLENK